MRGDTFLKETVVKCLIQNDHCQIHTNVLHSLIKYNVISNKVQILI